MPPLAASVVLIRCGPWWALGELLSSATLWWFAALARPGKFTVEWAVRHTKATFALLSFWLATSVFALAALLTPMSHGRWTTWEVGASIVAGVGVTALMWPMQRAYYSAMLRERSTPAESDDLGWSSP
jgi:hypothetical protein